MVVFLMGPFSGLIILVIYHRCYLADCMLNVGYFWCSMQLIQIWTVPPLSLVFMMVMEVSI